MKEFTALILAAGQGTRLRPITDNIPKCMVKVCGRSILHRQLDTFENVGIKKIYVVAGYKEEKIIDSRIVKIINQRYAETNMVYSLFCAEQLVEGNLIISYGDIFYTEEVLQRILSSQKDIVIASDKSWEAYWKSRCENPLSDAETFKKGEEGQVLSLGKKPHSREEIEGQFIGLIKLTTEGRALFRETYYNCKYNNDCSRDAWGSGRSLDKAYMTDLLNQLAKSRKLYYCEIDRGWFEIDNYDDLKVAENYLSMND